MAHDFLINKIIGENADSNFPLVLFGDKTIAVDVDGSDIVGSVTLYTGVLEYLGESVDIIAEVRKWLDEKSAHTPIFYAPNIDYTNVGLNRTNKNVSLYSGIGSTAGEVKILNGVAYLASMYLSASIPANIGDPFYITLDLLAEPLP